MDQATIGTEGRIGTNRITEGTLGGFIRSTQFFQHGLLPFVVYSDGCDFLCENGAAWLIDAIASYQTKDPCRSAQYQLWDLYVDTKNSCAVLIARAQNDNCDFVEIVRQDIGYVDFPLDRIQLICALNEENGKTIYLASEE